MEQRRDREAIWNLANLMRAKKLPHPRRFIMDTNYENKAITLTEEEEAKQREMMERLKDEMKVEDVPA